MSKYNPLLSIYEDRFGLNSPQYLGVSGSQSGIDYSKPAREMGADKGRAVGKVIGGVAGAGVGAVAGRALMKYLHKGGLGLSPAAAGAGIFALLTGAGSGIGAYAGARAGRKRHGEEYDAAKFLSDHILEKNSSLVKEAVWSNLLYTLGRRVGKPLIRGVKTLAGKGLESLGSMTGETGLTSAGGKLLGSAKKSLSASNKLDDIAAMASKNDPKHFTTEMERLIKEVGNKGGKLKGGKPDKVMRGALDEMGALQGTMSGTTGAGLLGGAVLTGGAYKAYDYMRGEPRYVMPLKYSEHVPFERLAKPDWMVQAEGKSELLEAI